MIKLEHVKVYADGANREAILALNDNPIVKGFTTNPTLMNQAGIKDYRGFALDLVPRLEGKPISFEVFADEFREMERQALEIKTWGSNVYVKIPVTNSLGASSVSLIRELAGAGVKLNVTAVFTLQQVLEVTQALKGGAPSVVSVFAGRVADSGRDPVPLMAAAREICRQADSRIELLWASPRELLNIVQADQIQCDIITVTPDLIKKLGLLNKDLTQFSLETVQMFKRDADAAGYRL